MEIPFSFKEVTKLGPKDIIISFVHFHYIAGVEEILYFL